MQKLSLRLFINFVFTLLAASLFVPSLHANINNIKGTYDILKPEFKQFSVIHGAVAWETGTIRRMYDLGALGNEIGKEMNGKPTRNIPNIRSKTIQLIYYIFFRRPGTTSIGEFVVTQKISSLQPTVVAEFVSDMMIYLKKLPEKDFFKEYKAFFVEYENANDKRKPVLAAILRKNHAKINTELETTEIQKFTNYPEPLRKLFPYVANAYLECAVEGYMPSYTPALILLSLLYKQTSLNRDAIETYYKRLQSNSDCLEMPTNWNTWKEDIFQKSTWSAIKTEVENTPITNATIHALYEKYVLTKFAPTNYPHVVPFSYRATIAHAAELITFADCMDNTVRNILNFLSYNPQTQLFDTDLLGQRLTTTVPTLLKTFYTKNPSPTSAEELSVHSDWAQMVISNIPFVSYNSALPDVAKKSEFGYIKINGTMTPELEQFLKNKKFTVLSDSNTAYELNPSIKNLIIVLDYLLGLHLFTEEPLTQAFIRTDFVEFYLPKCAKALKASLPKSLTLKDVDKNDYTSKPISLLLTLSFNQPEEYKADLTIKTTKSHGEFFFDQEDQKLPNLLSNLTSLNNYPSSSILFIPHTADLVKTFDLKTSFLWLFSEAIDNSLWIKKLKDPNLKNKTMFSKKNILDLLLFAAKTNNADYVAEALEEERQAAAEEERAEEPVVAVKEVIRDTLILYKVALENSNFSEKIALEFIKVTKNSCTLGDPQINDATLKLLEKLIPNPQIIGTLLQLALDSYASENGYCKEFSILLFKVLIEKLESINPEEKRKEILQKAIEAAQNLSKSKDPEVQPFAFELFETLVEKGYALTQATEAGQQFTTSEDEDVQYAATELLETIRKSRATTPVQATP